MKTIHYIIIAVVVIILAVLFLFSKDIKAAMTKTVAPPVDPANPTAPAPLDRNKTLLNGVYNSREVEELQRKLGAIDIDGDFGPKTERRLQYVKGVQQTTLNIFDTLPNITHGASDTWDNASNVSYSSSGGGIMQTVNDGFTWLFSL